MSNEKKIVACLGSSTTAGKGQAFNWIGELEKRPQNKRFHFYNFGVGGDLSCNALERLSDVVVIQPDKIIILIGGNDILASVFKNIRRFFTISKHLHRKPSSEWFHQNLKNIVHKLKAQTSAEVALVSLPQIGEDPNSSNPVQHALNILYKQYGEIIKQIAQQESVNYIPMYERLNECIVASPGRAFTSFRFLSFYLDTFRFFVLRQTSEQISQKNGWCFHVDGVHLNRRGGIILANLVQKFLDEDVIRHQNL